MKASLRIYYADDDQDDLEFVKAAAESSGHTIKTFETGDELIHALCTEHEHPDMVFLDVNMPHKSGCDVLCEIRKCTDWSSVPVIMFSTTFSQALIREYIDAGANYLLKKPTSVKEFLQTLSQMASKDWATFKPTAEEFFVTIV